jgi:hypothetical protein
MATMVCMNNDHLMASFVWGRLAVWIQETDIWRFAFDDCFWPPRARHTSHPMTAIQRSHTKRVKDPNKAATVVKKLATPTAKPEFELHRFAIRRSHLR